MTAASTPVRSKLRTWLGIPENTGKAVYMAVPDRPVAVAYGMVVPSYLKIYPVKDFIWDNPNGARSFRAAILHLRCLDDASLETLLAHPDNRGLEEDVAIATLLGIELNENTDWKQWTVLGLTLRIHLALQQVDATHQMRGGAFLQYNTIERRLFFQPWTWCRRCCSMTTWNWRIV